MIFTQSLQRIDASNPQDALKKMANHIKYLQEQLEYTLLNLDSRNINEIDIDKTTITDSTGSTSLGSFIYITGPNGESFTVGKNPQGKFEFAVKGKDGKQALYLNSSGELIVTEHANLTIDGGEW
ncbi:MAG: hypothetical protein E7408_03275 [Ruminococcaceae bacterium]|nr:hypothetical protein [Oscillospiraceae bacterium]